MRSKVRLSPASPGLLCGRASAEPAEAGRGSQSTPSLVVTDNASAPETNPRGTGAFAPRGAARTLLMITASARTTDVDESSKAGTRHGKRAAAVQLFVQRYARKTRAGGLDPNDRGFDRRVEREVRRMSPERLDALLRGGEHE